MKTRCSYDVSKPHGEQHPTPPRGRLKGHHATRKDDTSQDVSAGPDLREGTPDPCTHKLGPPDYGPGLPSQHARSLGWGPDPSEVIGYTTTGTRDRGDPSISKGPLLHASEPYPARMRSPLRRRPDAGT
jgi:hypothetical protein